MPTAEKDNIVKRRTLDIAFSIGGIVFSVLLLIVGLILTNQKNFAKNYVRDQLAAQEISFKSADTLVSDADFQATLLKAFGTQAAVDGFVADKHLTSEASSKCLKKYAGKQMLTGKQAECYAEDFIRLHALEASVVDGKSYTYASIGPLVTAANKAVTDAKTAGKPQTEIDKLQVTATGLQTKRVDTLLRGDAARLAPNVIRVQCVRRACWSSGPGLLRRRARPLPALDCRFRPRLRVEEGRQGLTQGGVTISSWANGEGRRTHTIVTKLP